MPSSQSKFDVEYISGEFGENYDININQDNGDPADISWATKGILTVRKPDGTLLFEDDTISILTSKVRWAMTEAQTEAGSSYTGNIDVQVELKDLATPTIKRLVKVLKGFIYKKITT